MSAFSNLHAIATFWYRPIQTVRGLVEQGQGHAVACANAGLLGMVTSLRFCLGSAEGAAAMFYWLPAGFLGGLGILYFLALLVSNFGRWLGGHARLQAIRTALGMACLPWLLLCCLLTASLFSGMDAAAVASFWPVFFVLFIYSYVLLLLSVMTVLGIGALRTTLTLAISFVVAFFLLSAIARVFFSPV
jgi:hypothetical protein